jgi:hypothetical protein
MMTFLPQYNGSASDFTNEPMTQAVGYFARGATGRVCLVMVGEYEGPNHNVTTLEEVEAWAESVPGGYLDF